MVKSIKELWGDFMLSTILMMISSLGALLVGFKLLSENIEKLATNKLKKLFNKTQNNKLAGVGIGLATTAIVESSAATTVMVVGLVNAGAMSLYQATAVIMGANIGTTVTAQIVALSSFNFAEFAICLTLIGILLATFLKKDKIKSLGLALAGLGLVFFGLKMLKGSMSDIVQSSSTLQDLLTSIGNPILLLVIGLVFTALAQSSTAITAILISMAAAGIQIGNGGNSILFVILGTNIGTCVTALMSSVGANTNAKRASMIHLLFNTLGALIFFIMLVSYKGFMDDTFRVWFADKPATQIAMFHTFFNLICAAIFLPLTKLFVWLSTKLVKDRPVKKEVILSIDERMLAYPSVALAQIGKDISFMSYEANRILNSAIDDFFAKQTDNKEDIDKTNEKLEIMNEEIIGFLVKISSNEVSYQDEQTVSAFHSNLNDILRIGELADNITKYTKSVVRDNLEFSDHVITEIGVMRDKINQLYLHVDMAFTSRSVSNMDKIESLESEIDDMRTKLIDDHLERLNAGKCQPQSSGVFVNLVSNLERAADHLTYIAESVKKSK